MTRTPRTFEYDELTLHSAPPPVRTDLNRSCMTNARTALWAEAHRQVKIFFPRARAIGAMRVDDRCRRAPIRRDRTGDAAREIG